MSRKLFDNEDEGLIAAINVTPLVDVVLVLLIIFMVTASFIVRETIEVQLPRAASGGESVGMTVNLVLDERGVLYLDGEETTMEAARRAVRELARRDEDAKAIISADKRLSHGRVVEIIDLVKSEGLNKFAINIEKDEAASSSP
ncbi:MAG TPA: biopolymer transporter ExbD [Fredinandcohnia sp.]|nr:biopolymer transporter ExbD [Fredinandcohnia sp.]